MIVEKAFEELTAEDMEYLYRGAVINQRVRMAKQKQYEEVIQQSDEDVIMEGIIDWISHSAERNQVKAHLNNGDFQACAKTIKHIINWSGSGGGKISYMRHQLKDSYRICAVDGREFFLTSKEIIDRYIDSQTNIKLF